MILLYSITACFTEPCYKTRLSICPTEQRYLGVLQGFLPKLQTVDVKPTKPIMTPGVYKHTIEDIQQYTGLSRHLINRCSSKLSELLDPFRTYGDSNRVLYDDNGLAVFDHIKQLKEQGNNIPEIRDVLTKQLQSPTNAGAETLQTKPAKPQNRGEAGSDGQKLDEVTRLLIAELKAAHEREVAIIQEAKRETLSLKDEIIREKDQKLMLLTEGRAPEEVQAERQRQLREQVMLEQKIEHFEQQKKGRVERAKKQQHLLSELAKVQGRWGKRKQRNALLDELQQLDHLG